MLDELLELSNYTYKIDDGNERQQIKRLKFVNLAGDLANDKHSTNEKDSVPGANDKSSTNEEDRAPSLSGLERAMIIVARNELFPIINNDGITAKQVEKQVEKAKQALKDWLNGWLKRYVEKVLMADCDQEACQAILKRIDQKVNGRVYVRDDQEKRTRPQFEHAMFSCDFGNTYEEHNNDFKIITYDKVLCEAFHKGPLKRKYLLCHNKEEIMKRIKKKTNAGHSNRCIGEKDEDLFFKMIAAFFLEWEKDSSRSFVAINQTDISNWTINKNWRENKNKNVVKWYQKFFYEKPDDKTEQLVFQKDIVRTEGANVTKISLDPEIRKQFALVDEKDGDKIRDYLRNHQDADCFIDCGPTMPLYAIGLKSVLDANGHIERALVDLALDQAFEKEKGNSINDGVRKKAPDSSLASTTIECILRIRSKEKDENEKQQLRKTLFESAKKLGLLPDREDCVYDMLKQNGFTCKTAVEYKLKKNGTKEKFSVENVCKKMCDDGTEDYVMIQTFEKHSPGGVMSLYLFNGKNDYEQVLGICNETESVNLVWVHNPDDSDAENENIRWAEDKKRDCTDSINADNTSDPYKYHQPNPKGISTNDCVVRALSCLFGCTWEDIIDWFYNDSDLLTINDYNSLSKLLKKAGLTRCNAVRQNKNRIKGVDFCKKITRDYQNGERIFALVSTTEHGRGKNKGKPDHAVAVCPDNHKVYKAFDSWNCLDREFDQYWVFNPRTSNPIDLMKGKPLMSHNEVEQEQSL